MVRHNPRKKWPVEGVPVDEGVRLPLPRADSVTRAPIRRRFITVTGKQQGRGPSLFSLQQKRSQIGKTQLSIRKASERFSEEKEERRKKTAQAE